jgi:hypothetical protein
VYPPLKLVLLCVSFTSAILSQALERVVKSEPYQDRHDRFRRASDSFLVVNGWASIWNMIMGPTWKCDDKTLKAMKLRRQDWERRFLDVLTYMDNDYEFEPVRPDLRMKRRVEEVVGKKATRQMLDLAVMDALQKEKLSEATIMKTLENVNS